MKLLVVLALFVAMASCGSDNNDKSENSNIKPETMEKLETTQDDNVSLERLDGQLDSLINEIE